MPTPFWRNWKSQVYRVELVLFGLPKTTNGSHGHWFAAAAERKKWRKKVQQSLLGEKKPDAPLSRAKVTCIRFSSSRPDYDNLSISFKSCVDGLRDAGILVDDKDSVVVERAYLWEKTAPKQGRIKIIVEEI